MKEESKSCLLTIKVKTRQPQFAVRFDPLTSELKVALTKPAVDGKANTELIQAFRHAFGNCELKSGLTQSRKVVRVSASKEEVIRWIQNQS